VRTLVVVNPHATMTTPRARDVLLAALHDRLAVELLITERRGHATEAAAKARANGYDLVVAYGGDGTVNEVVNGLLGDGPGPEVPHLGIVPGGRTNVLSRNLGIANDPIEAAGQLLDAVRTGSLRTLGLGTADDRWFTFNTGLGLDAATVAVVEEARARGRTATHGLYVASAFRAYFGRERRDRAGRELTVSRPGHEPVPGLDLAIVANCSPWTYLGERPVIATPEASFDTGLDVVALRRLTALSTLRPGLVGAAGRPRIRRAARPRRRRRDHQRNPAGTGPGRRRLRRGARVGQVPRRPAGADTGRLTWANVPVGPSAVTVGDCLGDSLLLPV
jgi:diacylglycerol kinase family enzyme